MVINFKSRRIENSCKKQPVAIQARPKHILRRCLRSLRSQGNSLLILGRDQISTIRYKVQKKQVTREHSLGKSSNRIMQISRINSVTTKKKETTCWIKFRGTLKINSLRLKPLCSSLQLWKSTPKSMPMLWPITLTLFMLGVFLMRSTPQYQVWGCLS